MGDHDGKIEFEFQKTLQQLVWMKEIKCVRPKEINSSIVDARKLLFCETKQTKTNKTKTKQTKTKKLR